MRDAFSAALVNAAQLDSKVLLLTGDHGYALFDEFRLRCPNQYLNCGIAEQNMVGVAAGLAKAGFKPVVYGLAAFVPIRVMEQIKIDVCYENLPVIFVGDGAGVVYSHLGSSHQCTEDIACTRALPNLTIFSPADRFEMSRCMELAFASTGPIYLRMGKSDRGDIHTSTINFEVGDLLEVQRGDGVVTIVATGAMVKAAIEIGLEEPNIGIWSAPTIKPMSIDQVVAIAQTADCIVTLEEHSIINGLGSCIAEIASEYSPTLVKRIGVDDRFSDRCGTWEYLLKEHQLDLASLRRNLNETVTSSRAKRA